MLELRRRLPPWIGISLSLMSAGAGAADPLGFYVGGAIGESNVRFHQDGAFSQPIALGQPGLPLPIIRNRSGLDFQESHSAWKLFAGIRPLSWVGAELDYMDFGRANTSYQTSTFLPSVTSATADAKAAALYGLLYLPLPVPWLDLYGKGGVARLQSSVGATQTYSVFYCPTLDPTCNQSRFQRSTIDVHPAYGLGAQIKITHFAVRAEYERISVSSGDLDLLSLGVSWSF